ncbi:acetylornithine aminotransferase [Dimargaris verticillata]|uniref:Acetylornithine aminotransferase n=1 Tax=Dimargaris verticillata TaxID=2761393 RepID=A0A9W8ECV7_9FUNG|nr:acetylornithine aminotransferase [Dimargaris verticillata]
MSAKTVVSQLPRPEVERLYKAFLDVVGRWPKDPLRMDQDFATVLSQRIHSELGPLVGEPAPKAVAEAQSTPTPPPATPPTPAPGAKAFDALSLEQIGQDLHAFQAIVGDKFKQQYPLSESILKPKIAPIYYIDMLEKLDNAATNPPKAPNFFQRWFRLRWQ